MRIEGKSDEKDGIIDLPNGRKEEADLILRSIWKLIHPMYHCIMKRLKNNLGVVCVTAGPGSTNAVPGLAEAFVDSGAVLVLSGQVERSHTHFTEVTRVKLIE